MSAEKNFKVVGNMATVLRPKVWDDVIGQEPVVRALRGMLKSGELKQAFLFSGEHGCGKTTAARLLAATVNCKNPKNMNPCGKCKSCLSMQKAVPDNPDYLELDGASQRGIDNVRALQNFVAYKPQNNVRFVAIDEVHGLTPQAQDAALKLIESPPEHIILILLTTNPQGLSNTVLSRLYRVMFRTPTIKSNVELMRRVCESENVKLATAVLERIADVSANHTRDCLNLLSYVIDQVRFDGDLKKALKEDLDTTISKLIQTTSYKTVEDFTTALLCGKRRRLVSNIRQVENKVYFLKQVQELLVEVMYLTIGDTTTSRNTFVAKRVCSTSKPDESFIQPLAKLVQELASVQLKTSQYTVDAEHASIGLFLKYCDLFSESK